MKHLVLVGPTACGKSSLAMALARARPGVEIVSVDSMQVYRGMDIGTAKATAAERASVPHHLIDVAEPGDRFTVTRFTSLLGPVLRDIEARGAWAILVGGTGLYFQAAIGDLQPPGEFPDVRASLENTVDLHARLEALDPLAASRIEPSNTRRLLRALEVTIGSGRPFSSYGPGVATYPPVDRFDLVGVWLPRTVLAARIEARVGAMVRGGLVEEVRVLGPSMGPTASQALGYKEMLAYLAGSMDLATATAQIVSRTREFGRRQRAWLRRDPRLRWHGTAADPDRLVGGLLAELDACG